MRPWRVLIGVSVVMFVLQNIWHMPRQPRVTRPHVPLEAKPSITPKLPEFGTGLCHHHGIVNDIVACVLEHVCWSPAFPHEFFMSLNASLTVQHGLTAAASREHISQPFYWPFNTTTDVNRLTKWMKAREPHVPIVHLPGSLLVVPTYSPAIVDFLASYLPVINLLSHSTTLGIPSPYRTLFHHQHPHNSQRMLIKMWLHFLNRMLTEELVIDEEGRSMKVVGQEEDNPTAQNVIDGDVPLSVWQGEESLGSEVPSTSNRYVVCFERMAFSPQRWFLSVGDSAMVRRAIYGAMHLKPIAYGPSRQEALENARRLHLHNGIFHACSIRSQDNVLQRALPSTSTNLIGEVVIMQSNTSGGIANLENVTQVIQQVTGKPSRHIGSLSRGIRSPAKELAQTRILLASHDSSLIHLMFLPIGSVVIEVLPFGCRHRDYFADLALSSGVVRLSYYNSHFQRTHVSPTCLEHMQSVAFSDVECAKVPECAACAKDAQTEVDIPELAQLIREAQHSTRYVVLPISVPCP